MLKISCFICLIHLLLFNLKKKSEIALLLLFVVLKQFETKALEIVLSEILSFKKFYVTNSNRDLQKKS